MKILVDMNLSPDWVPVLKRQGWEAIHWSRIGNPDAPEEEILRWSKKWLISA
jgi:predicted nuclease of predicted toxin-antitoxin system